MIEQMRSAGARTGADADAVAWTAPYRIASGAGHDRVVHRGELRATRAECVDRRVGGRAREDEQILAAAELRVEAEFRSAADDCVTGAGNARAEDGVGTARAELD